MKKAKHLCKTKYCRRSKNGHRSLCNTCEARAYRARHPIKYVYDTLKRNAKRRDKIFTITLVDFTEFIAGTDYLERRGRKNENLTIDRIDNNKGYILGNLRVMTNLENKKKYVEWFRNREVLEGDIVVGDNSNLPF